MGTSMLSLERGLEEAWWLTFDIGQLVKRVLEVRVEEVERGRTVIIDQVFHIAEDIGVALVS